MKAAMDEAKPEASWIVWQDTRGVWVGTKQEFEQSRRQETVISDAFGAGDNPEADALYRAVQMGGVMQQTYAACVLQYGQGNLKGTWLHYDDAAQGNRIGEWGERLEQLTLEP
jgi:hypothetical protein